jgi:hypothetical protein
MQSELLRAAIVVEDDDDHGTKDPAPRRDAMCLPSICMNFTNT